MTTISAAICTRNRSRYLRLAIDSLLAQRLDAGSAEIIVVDNGSSDDTRSLVQDYARQGVRYVHEPAAGLSRARNSAWRVASGRYIAYIDDDAVADPDWLERIVERFENLDPAPGSVGGRVSAIWEARRPSWLVPELEPWLGIIDWSPELSWPRCEVPYLVGTNVAFQRRLLERLGGFDPRLGRRGDNLMGNEEILVQHRLASAGHPPCYDPHIHVRHHVKRERLRRRWFARRFFWQGVTDEVYERMTGGGAQAPATGAGDAASAMLYLSVAAARSCILRPDAALAGFRACYRCGRTWSRMRSRWWPMRDVTARRAT